MGVRRGKKVSPSLNLSHISYNHETWHSYTLPKEDPKNIWITWHTSSFLLTSAFSHWKFASLLFQEIQIQIPFWSIISNSFNYFWVFKDCFNKNGYSFDYVSKNSYSRHSWNKGFLKDRLWRRIFVHEVTNKIL